VQSVYISAMCIYKAKKRYSECIHWEDWGKLSHLLLKFIFLSNVSCLKVIFCIDTYVRVLAIFTVIVQEIR